MKMPIYPWLEPTLQQWQQNRTRLHHAWILQGMPGIGKGQLARAMAAALLCEEPDAQGGACGVCTGCHLFELGHHPDFRVLQPPPEEDEKGKRKLPIIAIEQVRELADFIGLTAHRGAYRVVLVEPAEALNAAAANALLKTLEEPPEKTLFLLVSHQPSRLLPTIKSRCRSLAVPPPSLEVATAWLKAKGVKDPAQSLAFVGGAPLAALELGEEGQAEWRGELIGALRAPQSLDVMALARKLEKSGMNAVWAILSRWVHDLALCSAQSPLRYFPQETNSLTGLVKRMDLFALLSYEQRLGRDYKLLNHPLQARLVLEQWFSDYRGLFRRP